MDDQLIVTVFVVIADLCSVLKPPMKYRPQMSRAEIVLVAVVAALYFDNNQERALLVLRQCGYIPADRCLSVSRYNRQLHQHADLVESCVEVLVWLAREGELFVIDSLPVPVCRRKRARRCRKVRGRIYCGYCAAKDEKFFGFRLHLVCTPGGLPVAFQLLPAALHDLTAIYELSYELPAAAKLLGDKAFNDATAEATLLENGLRLVPIRRSNMQPNTWDDDYDLRHYRRRIETVISQLEAMGLERLRATTLGGLAIKINASLLALWLKNAFQSSN